MATIFKFNENGDFVENPDFSLEPVKSEKQSFLENTVAELGLNGSSWEKFHTSSMEADENTQAMFKDNKNPDYKYVGDKVFRGSKDNDNIDMVYQNGQYMKNSLAEEEKAKALNLNFEQYHTYGAIQHYENKSTQMMQQVNAMDKDAIGRKEMRKQALEMHKKSLVLKDLFGEEKYKKLNDNEISIRDHGIGTDSNIIEQVMWKFGAGAEATGKAMINLAKDGDYVFNASEGDLDSYYDNPLASNITFDKLDEEAILANDTAQRWDHAGRLITKATSAGIGAVVTGAATGGTGTGVGGTVGWTLGEAFWSTKDFQNLASILEAQDRVNSNAYDSHENGDDIRRRDKKLLTGFANQIVLNNAMDDPSFVRRMTDMGMDMADFVGAMALSGGIVGGSGKLIKSAVVKSGIKNIKDVSVKKIKDVSIKKVKDTVVNAVKKQLEAGIIKKTVNTLGKNAYTAVEAVPKSIIQTPLQMGRIIDATKSSFNTDSVTFKEDGSLDLEHNFEFGKKFAVAYMAQNREIFTEMALDGSILEEICQGTEKIAGKLLAKLPVTKRIMASVARETFKTNKFKTIKDMLSVFKEHHTIDGLITELAEEGLGSGIEKAFNYDDVYRSGSHLGRFAEGFEQEVTNADGWAFNILLGGIRKATSIGTSAINPNITYQVGDATFSKGRFTGDWHVKDENGVRTLDKNNGEDIVTIAGLEMGKAIDERRHSSIVQMEDLEQQTKVKINDIFAEEGKKFNIDGKMMLEMLDIKTLLSGAVNQRARMIDSLNIDNTAKKQLMKAVNSTQNRVSDELNKAGKSADFYISPNKDIASNDTKQKISQMGLNFDDMSAEEYTFAVDYLMQENELFKQVFNSLGKEAPDGFKDLSASEQKRIFLDLKKTQIPSGPAGLAAGEAFEGALNYFNQKEDFYDKKGSFKKNNHSVQGAANELEQSDEKEAAKVMIDSVNARIDNVLANIPKDHVLRTLFETAKDSENYDFKMKAINKINEVEKSIEKKIEGKKEEILKVEAKTLVKEILAVEKNWKQGDDFTNHLNEFAKDGDIVRLKIRTQGVIEKYEGDDSAYGKNTVTKYNRILKQIERFDDEINDRVSSLSGVNLTKKTDFKKVLDELDTEVVKSAEKIEEVKEVKKEIIIEKKKIEAKIEKVEKKVEKVKKEKVKVVEKAKKIEKKIKIEKSKKTQTKAVIKKTDKLKIEQEVIEAEKAKAIEVLRQEKTEKIRLEEEQAELKRKEKETELERESELLKLAEAKRRADEIAKVKDQLFGNSYEEIIEKIDNMVEGDEDFKKLFNYLKILEQVRDDSVEQIYNFSKIGGDKVGFENIKDGDFRNFDENIDSFVFGNSKLGIFGVFRSYKILALGKLAENKLSHIFGNLEVQQFQNIRARFQERFLNKGKDAVEIIKKYKRLDFLELSPEGNSQLRKVVKDLYTPIIHSDGRRTFKDISTFDLQSVLDIEGSVPLDLKSLGVVSDVHYDLALEEQSLKSTDSDDNYDIFKDEAVKDQDEDEDGAEDSKTVFNKSDELRTKQVEGKFPEAIELADGVSERTTYLVGIAKDLLNNNSLRSREYYAQYQDGLKNDPSRISTFIKSLDYDSMVSFVASFASRKRYPVYNFNKETGSFVKHNVTDAAKVLNDGLERTIASFSNEELREKAFFLTEAFQDFNDFSENLSTVARGEGKSMNFDVNKLSKEQVDSGYKFMVDTYTSNLDKLNSLKDVEKKSNHNALISYWTKEILDLQEVVKKGDALEGNEQAEYYKKSLVKALARHLSQNTMLKKILGGPTFLHSYFEDLLNAQNVGNLQQISNYSSVFRDNLLIMNVPQVKNSKGESFRDFKTGFSNAFKSPIQTTIGDFTMLQRLGYGQVSDVNNDGYKDFEGNRKASWKFHTELAENIDLMKAKYNNIKNDNGNSFAYFGEMAFMNTVQGDKLREKIEDMNDISPEEVIDIVKKGLASTAVGDFFLNNTVQIGERKLIPFLQCLKMNEVDAEKRYKQLLANTPVGLSFVALDKVAEYAKEQKMSKQDAYNKLYYDAIILQNIGGKFEQYNNKYSKFTKRAGNLMSSGFVPVIGIEGGLQETFTHVVIDEQADEALVRKITDLIIEANESAEVTVMDGISFARDAHFKQFQTSIGSRLAKDAIFDKFNTMKTLYSGINAEGKRGLTKTNVVNIDSLIEFEENEQGQKVPTENNDATLVKIWNVMETGGVDGAPIDTLSFDSGTKVNDGVLSTLEEPQAFVRESKNYTYQVDLRHDPNGKIVNQNIQYTANGLSFKNADNIAKTQSEIQNVNFLKFLDVPNLFKKEAVKKDQVKMQELKDLLVENEQERVEEQKNEVSGISDNIAKLNKSVEKSLDFVYKSQAIIDKKNRFLEHDKTLTKEKKEKLQVDIISLENKVKSAEESIGQTKEWLEKAEVRLTKSKDKLTKRNESLDAISSYNGSQSVDFSIPDNFLYNNLELLKLDTPAETIKEFGSKESIRKLLRREAESMPSMLDFIDSPEFSFDNAIYKEIIDRLLVSSIEKKLLKRKSNQVILTVLPQIDASLNGPVIINEEKGHIRLAEVNGNITNARYTDESEVYKTLDDAKKFITDNAQKYDDMFVCDEDGIIDFTQMRDWEIVGDEKTGFRIPGSIVSLTRVPADSLHSHHGARLRSRIRGEQSFIQVYDEGQIASGEDFDGDQRYVEFAIENTKGKTINKKINQSLRQIFRNFYDADVVREQHKGIELNYFDDFIDELDIKMDAHSDNSVEAFINARNSNREGQDLLAITASFKVVLDLMRKQTNEEKVEIDESLLDERAMDYLDIVIKKDVNNELGKWIGVLMNLSADNANEQKLPAMGLTSDNWNLYMSTMFESVLNASSKLEQIDSSKMKELILNGMLEGSQKSDYFLLWKSRKAEFKAEQIKDKKDAFKFGQSQNRNRDGEYWANYYGVQDQNDRKTVINFYKTAKKDRTVADIEKMDKIKEKQNAIFDGMSNPSFMRDAVSNANTFSSLLKKVNKYPIKKLEESQYGYVPSLSTPTRNNSDLQQYLFPLSEKIVEFNKFAKGFNLTPQKVEQTFQRYALLKYVEVLERKIKEINPKINKKFKLDDAKKQVEGRILAKSLLGKELLAQDHRVKYEYRNIDYSKNPDGTESQGSMMVKQTQDNLRELAKESPMDKEYLIAYAAIDLNGSYDIASGSFLPFLPPEWLASFNDLLSSDMFGKFETDMKMYLAFQNEKFEAKKMDKFDKVVKNAPAFNNAYSLKKFLEEDFDKLEQDAFSSKIKIKEEVTQAMTPINESEAQMQELLNSSTGVQQTQQTQPVIQPATVNENEAYMQNLLNNSTPAQKATDTVINSIEKEVKFQDDGYIELSQEELGGLLAVARNGKVYVSKISDLSFTRFLDYVLNSRNKKNQTFTEQSFDRLISVVDSVENLQRFLIEHERSHIRNNDILKYHKMSDSEKLKIEKRANDDALNAMGALDNFTDEQKKYNNQRWNNLKSTEIVTPYILPVNAKGNNFNKTTVGQILKEKFNVDIVISDLPIEIKGQYKKGLITLNSKYDFSEQGKVLFHELAHGILIAIEGENSPLWKKLKKEVKIQGSWKADEYVKMGQFEKYDDNWYHEALADNLGKILHYEGLDSGNVSKGLRKAFISLLKKIGKWLGMSSLQNINTLSDLSSLITNDNKYDLKNISNNYTKDSYKEMFDLAVDINTKKNITETYDIRNAEIEFNEIKKNKFYANKNNVVTRANNLRQYFEDKIALLGDKNPSLLNKAILLRANAKMNDKGEFDSDLNNNAPEVQDIINRAKSLSPIELEIVDEIHDYFETMYKEFPENSIGYLENYTSQLWANPEVANKGKSDTKLKDNKISQFDVDYAKTRKYVDMIAAWNEFPDLELKFDKIGDLLGNYHQVMSLELANLEFVKDGMSNGLLSHTPQDGYKMVYSLGFTNGGNAFVEQLKQSEDGTFEGEDAYLEHNELYQAKIYTVSDSGKVFKRVPIYAPVAVAEELDRMSNFDKGLRGRNVILDTLFKINAFLKQLMIQLSFFHHRAFLRSYYLGGAGVFSKGNWNPFTNYKNGVALRDAVENQGKKMGGALERNQTIDKKAIMENAENAKLEIVKMVIGAGMSTFKDEKPEFRKDNEHLFTRIPVIGTIAKMHSDWLFNTFGSGLKVNAAVLEFQHMMHKYPESSLDEIAQVTATVLNNDFGGIDHKMDSKMFGLIKRTNFTQDFLTLTCFAPDWTESNINLFIDSVKTKNNPMLRATSRRLIARAFWKAGMASVALNLLMAAMMDGQEDDDEDIFDKFIKIYKRSWKEGHLKWTGVDVTPVYKAFGDNSHTLKHTSVIGHFHDLMKASPDFSQANLWAKDFMSNPFNFIVDSNPVSFSYHKSTSAMKSIMSFMTGKDYTGERELLNPGDLVNTLYKKGTRTFAYNKGVHSENIVYDNMKKDVGVMGYVTDNISRLFAKEYYVEEVVSQYDGDTFEVKMKGINQGKAVNVRILGIDSEELKTGSAKALYAKRFFKKKLKEGDIKIMLVEGDVDAYGRYLGRVFINGEDYSQMALKSGHFKDVRDRTLIPKNLTNFVYDRMMKTPAIAASSLIGSAPAPVKGAINFITGEHTTRNAVRFMINESIEMKGAAITDDN